MVGGRVRALVPLSERADPSWRIRGYIAPEGIACLAGQTGACRQAVLSVPPLTRDTAWREAVVASTGTTVSQFFVPRAALPLGPGNGWLVSEMVRTLGPDKFGRFWRSQLPVDSAFAQASGQSLDNWAREWGERIYGQASVGPGVSIAGMATGLGVLILSLAVSVAVERRRRVA